MVPGRSTTGTADSERSGVPGNAGGAGSTWRATMRALWRDERPRVAIPRDIGIVVLFLALILTGLWGFTGQPFPSTSPLVVIESGSMMHPDAPYGRVGTIDAGDLVMVKRVDGATDVEPTYGGDRQGYGANGDVLVYRPYGDATRTPIIHRALTYVEVTTTTDDEGNETHRYSYWNDEGEFLENESSVTLSSASVRGMRPAHSGFVTKGDNPDTNQFADQISHMPQELVRPEWIVGKARGEIPWLGLVKLALTGNPVPQMAEQDSQCKFLRAWAPCDEWVMLALSFGALILVPFGLERFARHSAAFRRWLDP